VPCDSTDRSNAFSAGTAVGLVTLTNVALLEFGSSLLSYKGKAHFFPFAVQKRERTSAGCGRYNRREDEGQTQWRSEKNFNVERKVGRGGMGGEKLSLRVLLGFGICQLDVLM